MQHILLFTFSRLKDDSTKFYIAQFILHFAQFSDWVVNKVFTDWLSLLTYSSGEISWCLQHNLF